MANRFSNLRPGLLLLALTIAALLWGVAHGSSSIERGFDVPVELHALKDTLVVTDLSSDAVNIRVQGSRAALRNLSADKLSYRIDISESKPGVAEYDVDISQIELPAGARVVSRSPARLEVRFEERGRKAVGVRPDIEGEPAEGFLLVRVWTEPRRVWLAGARSQVLRLSEVVTEPIDLTGLEESEEREVRLFMGGGTIWNESDDPVLVHIEIEPDPEALDDEAEAAAAEQAAGARDSG